MKSFKVYVDGSFNGYIRDEQGRQWTHGGFAIFEDNDSYAKYKGHVETCDRKLTNMNNVGGELLASYSALAALIGIIDPKQTRTCDDDPIDVELIYDYEGIGKWLTGAWAAKKPGTQWYVSAFRDLKNSCPNLLLRFRWTRGHNGDYGNELADRIANFEKTYVMAEGISVIRVEEV